jgi:hypothetical protein
MFDFTFSRVLSECILFVSDGNLKTVHEIVLDFFLFQYKQLKFSERVVMFQRCCSLRLVRTDLQILLTGSDMYKISVEISKGKFQFVNRSVDKEIILK